VRTLLVLVLLASLLLPWASARADEPSAHDAILRSARREKIIGMALSFTGLAVSLCGFGVTIANGGFDRDTHDERVRFGIGVGFAIGAVPLVTAGITLWARGAVREHRERARVKVGLNALTATF